MAGAGARGTVPRASAVPPSGPVAGGPVAASGSRGATALPGWRRRLGDGRLGIRRRAGGCRGGRAGSRRSVRARNGRLVARRWRRRRLADAVRGPVDRGMTASGGGRGGRESSRRAEDRRQQRDGHREARTPAGLSAWPSPAMHVSSRWIGEAGSRSEKEPGKRKGRNDPLISERRYGLQSVLVSPPASSWTGQRSVARDDTTMTQRRQACCAFVSG